ncbi:MAG: hypothetical protein GKS06_15655 [Acidobacteria bacterium]|nr:hypothetical protein [Acidobacteriota bacterium]
MIQHRNTQLWKWPSGATRGLSLAALVWRSPGWRRVVLCLAALGSLGLCASVTAQEVPQVSIEDLPDRFERLLVGALVGGKEGDTFEVLREQDRFYIPLLPLVSTCGCELESRPDGDYLVTPLGARRIGDEGVVVVDGIRYVSETFLSDELATELEFSQELYALRFMFPWRPGAPLRTEAANGELVELDADDTPAALSLTSARLNARYTRRMDTTTSTGSGLFHGRVAEGRWRFGLDQSIGGSTNFREYAWTRIMGQKLMLAGHQRVNLHPLMGGLELTGVQGAWTNQPLEAFAISSQPSELLPRSLRSATSITGRGPAAGFAELRIDGIVARVQVISLGGTYEFFDVQLPSRQSSRIEVYVYERFNRTAPIEIQDHTRGVSEYLLPQGATTIMGGAGLTGNYLADALAERSGAGTATGFVQARHGLSERVTVEAAVQTQGEKRQGVVGLTGSLGRNFVGSAAVATSGSAMGWDLDVQGYFDRVRVTARSQQNGVGFNTATSPQRYNHYGEVVFRPTGNLDIGLIAASRNDGFNKSEYVRPMIAWQPTATTWLRAQPDALGRYRFDFSWAVNQRTRMTAGYIDERAILGVTSYVSRNVGVSASAEWDENYGHRQAVQASLSTDSAWEPGFIAGVRRTHGQLGVTVGAQATIGPGVLLSAQFENDPRFNDPLARRDPRITVRMFTDLAFAGGQVMGGRSYSLSSTRGAVGGRVRVEGQNDIDPAMLAGLAVLVDGRAVGRTQRGGRFYFGNLRPGVYLVEIDTAGLPIELNMRDAVRRVRVEPGAVTGADFVAVQEFGFAGRVTVEDQIFSFATVELLDARGQVLQSVRADRFGLYRFDGVPAGMYRVRLSPKNAPGSDVIWPVIDIDVRDFTFGNDLVLRRIDIRELSVPEELSGALTGPTGGAGAQQGSGSGQQQSQQQDETLDS